MNTTVDRETLTLEAARAIELRIRSNPEAATKVQLVEAMRALHGRYVWDATSSKAALVDAYRTRLRTIK